MNKNLITGEEFERIVTDFGVETIPKQFCYASQSGHGVTGNFDLGSLSEDELSKFCLAMEDICIGLSQMTGKKITFKDTRNSPAIWGCYGMFHVENPKLFTDS